LQAGEKLGTPPQWVSGQVAVEIPLFVPCYVPSELQSLRHKSLTVRCLARSSATPLFSPVPKPKIADFGHLSSVFVVNREMTLFSTLFFSKGRNSAGSLLRPTLHQMRRIFELGG
jgi:hypothetical protein